MSQLVWFPRSLAADDIANSTVKAPCETSADKVRSGSSSVENAFEQKDAKGTKGRRGWTGQVADEGGFVRHSAGIFSYLCYLRCLLFNGNYPSVRLLDEEAILACAAYVDLNPIRAGLAPTSEESQFTLVQRRIQALEQETQVSPSPVQIDQVYSSDEASSLV